MCGLFGVVAYRSKNTDMISKMVMALGKESEVRGTDAGGLSLVMKDLGMTTVRNAGAISRSGVFQKLNANRVVMGHTRMTTQGTATHAYNNHPFPSKAGAYTMAHNGIISNDHELAREHKLPDTKVETDSYIVVRMLDHLHNGVISFDTLRSVAEQLQGQFNLTFHTHDGIWIVRHNNPLEVINLESEGMVIYASTRDILVKALKSYYDTTDMLDYLLTHKGSCYGTTIKTNSGDIILIRKNGEIERGSFTPKVVTYTAGRSSYYDDYYDDYYYSPRGHKTQSWVKPSTTVPATYVDVSPLDTIFDRCKTYYKNGAVFFNGDESEVGLSYMVKGKEFYYSQAKGKALEVDGTSVIPLCYLKDYLPLSNPRLPVLDLYFAEFSSALKLFYSSPAYTKLLSHLNTVGNVIPSFSTTVLPFITHYLFYTACQTFNPNDYYVGVATVAGVSDEDLTRLFNAEAERLMCFRGVQSLFMHVVGHLHMFEDEVTQYLKS